MNALSSALNIPSDKLFGFLGHPGGETAEPATESAILTDDRLTDAQKQSLLDVLSAFLAANEHT